jgi:diguanylate cyclase (GGDEF)-like protein
MTSVLLLHNLYQFLFAVVYIYLYRSSAKRVPGLGYWTFNLIVNTLAAFISLFAQVLNPLLSLALPLLLYTAGGVSFYFALAAFRDRVAHVKMVVLTSLILNICAVSAAIFGLPLQYTLLCNTIAFIFLAVMYLTVAVPNLTGHWYRPFMFVLAVIYMLVMANQLFRIGILIDTISDQVAVRSAVETPGLLVTGMLSRGFLFIVNFIILMLVYGKLVSDLEQDAEHKSRLLEKLKVISRTDKLTGLLNRMSIEQRTEDLISQGMNFGLLLVDIDDFKHINDTYGHDAGDLVLKSLSGIFQDALRGKDLVGRWGGDEFLIIISDAGRRETSVAASRIMAAVRGAGELEGGVRHSSVSIGAAVSGSAQSAAELFKHADINLYEAKTRGKNRIFGI